MAAFPLLDARLTVATVNMSSFLTSATLNVEVEELESTAMGNLWRTRLGGLKDFSFDMEFNDDKAAAAVDVTFWPLLGTVVPFTIRATTAAIGATNPEYTGSLLVSQLTPIDGSVGDLAKNSLTWPGSGALVRGIV